MTCYIDTRSYELGISKLHVNHSLLGGLRVLFKMYSGLCPWLLTWSDYEEDYDDECEEFNDAGAN
jgi:hypothetical protein